MNDVLAGFSRGSTAYRGGPSLTQRLLPNEPRIVNFKAQSVLTERYLLPVLADLEAFFLALRTSVNPALRQCKPLKLGKPYPLGQCLEITQAVQQKLYHAAAASAVNAAATRGNKAYREFRKAGGTFRQVWGDLRGEFFQNAFQLGTLYIDVANDTVTPSKPMVEILPFAEADLVPIVDFRHFTHLASIYWQDRFYPNHAVPELAPGCPLIHVMRNGHIRLAEATHYMVAMTQSTAFCSSEEVLRDDVMPADVFAHVVTNLAGTHWKLPQCAEQGRLAALRACREQRAKKWHLSCEYASNTITAALDINKRLVDGLSSHGLKDSQVIRIGDQDYNVADLSENARRQVVNLRVTDQEIDQLHQRLAIFQTARNAYERALSDELPNKETH